MSGFVVLLIPILLAAAVLRLLFLPIRLLFKLAVHAIGGLLCLWLLNSLAVFTGIFFPINPATVLISGVFGVPGMGFLAFLELL